MNGTLASELAADVDLAFPSLVADLARPVYSLALRLCGPGEAEDISQETFLRAYGALQEYPPERRRALRVRQWVLTIALNVARNRLRLQNRHPSANGRTPAETPADAVGPDAAAEHADLRDRLGAALLRLPAPSREAVVLRHVVGCRVTEVAAILGRPVGTVKAQVWRGLAALRDDLEADGPLWEER